MLLFIYIIIYIFIKIKYYLILSKKINENKKKINYINLDNNTNINKKFLEWLVGFTDAISQ